MRLHNIYDKQTLEKKIEAENFKRITLSFYNYVNLKNLATLRDELFTHLTKLNVLGRIYISKEGINAQISIPEFYFIHLEELFKSYFFLENVCLKKAVEERKTSFFKLKVKIRSKIVADGLSENIQWEELKRGKHLSAEKFNEIAEDKDSIVVDMRNHYESEVGYFKDAILPDTDSFRQTIPWVEEKLKNSKDKKILMYCTGGIRCEKASAYFIQKGFENVYQLDGGIIAYAKEIKEKKLKSKFIGKNFVFDDRLSEKITDDIVANCHQCGSKSDRHINCKNDMCHLLFIQCEECAEKMQNCCTEECRDIAHLPIEEQKELRKNKINRINHYNSKKQVLGPQIASVDN